MFDEVTPQASTPQPVNPPITPTPATPPAPVAPINPPVAPTSATGTEEIHTMPMDYYTGAKTANVGKPMQSMPSNQMAPAPGGKKKISNIIIIVVLALVVGVSAYLLYASYQKPANVNQTNNQVNNQVNTVVEPVVDEPILVEEDLTPLEIDPAIDEPVVENTKFDPSKLNEVSLSLMAMQKKLLLVQIQTLMIQMVTLMWMDQNLKIIIVH